MPLLQSTPKIVAESQSLKSPTEAESSQPSTPGTTTDLSTSSVAGNQNFSTCSTSDTDEHSTKAGPLSSPTSALAAEAELFQPSVPSTATQDATGQDLPTLSNATKQDNVPSPSDTGISNISALTEFALFPRFPTEIRLKIWSHALPGPRIVEIEWKDKTQEWFCPVESHSQRSGLLCANRESREVFLKSYVPLFKLGGTFRHVPAGRPGTWWKTAHKLSKEKCTYFDPDVDMLYVGPSSTNEICITENSITALAAQPWSQKLRVLACEYVEWFDGGRGAVGGSTVLAEENLMLLPRLQEIIITVDDIPYSELLSTLEHPETAVRPRGEIELIDLSDNRWPHQGMKIRERNRMEAIDGRFNNESGYVSQGRALKVKARRVLRGGNLSEPALPPEF